MSKKYNVCKIAVIPPIPGIFPLIYEKANIGPQVYDDAIALNPHLKAVRDNKNIAWMLYLLHTTPDADFIEMECAAGACCVKLHNAPLIMDGSDRQVFLSEKWERAFQAIDKCGVPVLWHVTQRMTDSPYTGGGRNSYWSIGWTNGVTYTNEDLLQDFLRIVERFPGINFIGAHSLHMGWERLSELLDKYDNLYVDTACIGYVRRGDRMYDADIEYYRKIFIKYSNRILFGTDLIMKENSRDKEFVENPYEGHIGFVKQLRLPYDVLQKIAHENAERLFKL